MASLKDYNIDFNEITSGVNTVTFTITMEVDERECINCTYRWVATGTNYSTTYLTGVMDINKDTRRGSTTLTFNNNLITENSSSWKIWSYDDPEKYYNIKLTKRPTDKTDDALEEYNNIEIVNEKISFDESEYIGGIEIMYKPDPLILFSEKKILFCVKIKAKYTKEILNNQTIRENIYIPVDYVDMTYTNKLHFKQCSFNEASKYANEFLNNFNVDINNGNAYAFFMADAITSSKLSDTIVNHIVKVSAAYNNTIGYSTITVPQSGTTSSPLIESYFRTENGRTDEKYVFRKYTTCHDPNDDKYGKLDANDVNNNYEYEITNNDSGSTIFAIGSEFVLDEDRAIDNFDLIYLDSMRYVNPYTNKVDSEVIITNYDEILNNTKQVIKDSGIVLSEGEKSQNKGGVTIHCDFDYSNKTDTKVCKYNKYVVESNFSYENAIFNILVTTSLTKLVVNRILVGQNLGCIVEVIIGSHGNFTYRYVATNYIKKPNVTKKYKDEINTNYKAKKYYGECYIKNGEDSYVLNNSNCITFYSLQYDYININIKQIDEFIEDDEQNDIADNFGKRHNRNLCFVNLGSDDIAKKIASTKLAVRTNYEKIDEFVDFKQTKNYKLKFNPNAFSNNMYSAEIFYTDIKSSDIGKDECVLVKNKLLGSYTTASETMGGTSFKLIFSGVNTITKKSSTKIDEQYDCGLYSIEAATNAFIHERNCLLTYHYDKYVESKEVNVKLWWHSWYYYRENVLENATYTIKFNDISDDKISHSMTFGLKKDKKLKVLDFKLGKKKFNVVDNTNKWTNEYLLSLGDAFTFNDAVKNLNEGNILSNSSIEINLGENVLINNIVNQVGYNFMTRDTDNNFIIKML